MLLRSNLNVGLCELGGRCGGGLILVAGAGRVRPLVDDLGDADDLTVVIAHRHAHQRPRAVARPRVDLAVKPRVLKCH